MTLAELERAEETMQQQWYELVMAEQQGSSLEVLEQMYDTYILLAEEYNRCCEATTPPQGGREGTPLLYKKPPVRPLERV